MLAFYFIWGNLSLGLRIAGSRDIAQPGRALALGARCRRFESACPDHLGSSFRFSDAPLAQLDRATAF